MKKIIFMFIGVFSIFAGNAYSQEKVIGNSYLWQENIKTQNYSFEREFNWQFTFLENNQVIAHKYHYANSNPRRITHAALTHYAWKLKDENLIVQRFWRDSKGKEIYLDYYYTISNAGLKLDQDKTVSHNGKERRVMNNVEESLDTFSLSPNDAHDIFKDWYDGQDERPIYWDWKAYKEQVINKRPREFVDFNN